MICMERVYIVNIENCTISKKSWKTYDGALKNCGNNQIPMTFEGYEWYVKHPEWRKERTKFGLTSNPNDV